MKTLTKVLHMAALLAPVAGLAMAVAATVNPEFRSTYGSFIVSVDAMQVGAMSWPLRAIVFVLPALAFAYAMFQLAALLSLAARDQVFSPPAAVHLRRFGLWLLITTLAGNLLPGIAQALHLLLTRSEHGQLGFSLSSADLWNIFISAVFMLVARVLADAYRIAEENRQII